MIENETQYEVTKYWLFQFKQGIQELKYVGIIPDVHPILVQAEQDGMQRFIEEFERDIKEYEEKRVKPI